MLSLLRWIFGSSQQRRLNKYNKIVQQIRNWEQHYQNFNIENIQDKTQEFKNRFLNGETLDSLLPEAYALVITACKTLRGYSYEVLGQAMVWNMVPYDVQLIGAIAMHHGNIAEMQTGEGKTLTATLALYLNALTSKPVHLITVNDYLAQRDCYSNMVLFKTLGLNVGALTNGIPIPLRKQIYACDIVYGTASEFGFDYLRDNSMSRSALEQVQRGYYFAIIDEIDSILIDEARTPLIISGPSPSSQHLYHELKDPAEKLVSLQKQTCKNLAAESWEKLESLKLTDPNEDHYAKKLDKEQQKLLDQAVEIMWLVSKSYPKQKFLRRFKENIFLRNLLEEKELFYYNETNKQLRSEKLAELHIIVDERHNDYELTEKGIHAWQSFSKEHSLEHDIFTLPDLGHIFSEIENDSQLSNDEKLSKKLEAQQHDRVCKERSHNLRQLLRAHLLMEKDVDYIVQNDKIIIIDENTGRPQPGRRFGEGLHQAIEAKENVTIEQETQTYATITLQNYFRMYEKLSGMSGTAITEAHEFKEIYKLEALEIPTHLKCIREDATDVIYMTEREKYNAILEEVKQVHAQGRPILIGTESVDASEKLSKLFEKNNLPHVVLNAKHHQHEAEIIAKAGEQFAITISTNMAGRGTDIKLAQDVAKLGGLYVIGATRYHSRRIDRQLRGRCARQGDPGSTKFFLSFEDSLIRLFASPKMTQMMQRYRPAEGQAVSSSLLSKSIETAQKRLEQRNFNIRKHTLEYDNVMNVQRQEIYVFRNELLHSDQVLHLAEESLESIPHLLVPEFFQNSPNRIWNPEGYKQTLMEYFPILFDEAFAQDESLNPKEIEKQTLEILKKAFLEKLTRQNEQLQKFVDDPMAVIDQTLRSIMIKKLDQLWQDHLLHMDHLRTELHLRALGQKDPLIEYKAESFNMFQEFSRNLKLEMASDFFKFELVISQEEPENESENSSPDTYYEPDQFNGPIFDFD